MSNSEFAEPYTIIEPFGGAFKGDVTVPGLSLIHISRLRGATKVAPYGWVAGPFKFTVELRSRDRLFSVIN